MKEIKGINHIGLRVKDLALARTFYEKLGFIFIAGPLGPEPVAIMEHPSGININFILNASRTTRDNILMDIPEKHPGFTHIALEVSRIEAIQVALTAQGIAITGGPIQFPDGGGVSLFIRDQDRNVIEFHQPAA